MNMLKGGKKSFKYLLISMAVILIFSTRFLSYLNTDTADVWCFDDELAPSANTLRNMESPAEVKRPVIFFVETSCASRTAGKVVLNARQACAVESAALMNPNSDVYVLFVSSTTFNASQETAIIQTLLNHTNVHFRHINLMQYTEGTLLDAWYRTRALHKSPYALSHTSDILRYLTLWKYGGTYLDLDVVVTSQLENLTPNFVGAEDDLDLAAGVLNFDKNGIGHSFVESCLEDLRLHYRGDIWGANGPGVVTRLAQRICDTERIPEMTSARCKGFTVYPPSDFYAIPWRKWRLFFNETTREKVMQILNKSRVIHVWNKVSFKAKVTVGRNQPYGLIAQKFCPNIYKKSGQYF